MVLQSSRMTQHIVLGCYTTTASKLADTSANSYCHCLGLLSECSMTACKGRVVSSEQLTNKTLKPRCTLQQSHDARSSSAIRNQRGGTGPTGNFHIRLRMLSLFLMG